MNDWLTALLSILGIASIGLFAAARSEKLKRTHAEKRAEVFEHQANVARETAKVMHEIAIERDNELQAVERSAEKLRKQVDEAADEIRDAANDTQKIAGLWNKTFSGEK